MVSPQSLIDNEHVNIGPGKGKQSKSILNDKFCEELSFPHLFPTGKLGYQVQAGKKFSPVKYFNQRLLHHINHLHPIQIIYFLPLMYNKKNLQK